MTAGGERFVDPDPNQTQNACNEDVCWQKKDAARFLYSSQINEGDENQDPETQAKGLALQRRYGGNQRAYSRRNADCGGENVIDHKRSRRQKAGPVTQVLAGDGVRSAALRIGRYSLPVGKIDDTEQNHDADGDRPDIDGSGHTQRDQ